MFRAVIIEDEEMAIAALEGELKTCTFKPEVIGHADTVESGMELIRSKEPNLVFLDIKLKDGLGFEILDKLGNNLKANVIVTTAYDNFMLEALRFSAVDYLLKPIDKAELEAALTRVQERVAINNVPIQTLLTNLQETNKALQKIALPTSEGFTVADINQIMYLSAEGNYTRFHFANRKPLLISKTMKRFESLTLSDSFFRIHSSYLVNLQHVQEYLYRDGGTVLLSNAEELPVSFRKRKAVVDRLKQLS